MISTDIGGYRLLRVLGEGARAVVYLAHDGHDPAAREPVAVKLFRNSVTPDAISVEVDALTRAAGPHVVGVHDLSTTAEGTPALILERLPGSSLASLLAARSSLRRGEVVTILAPIVEAVRRMQLAGVSHGALNAGSIGFTATGAPTLWGFGAAQVGEPELSLARREQTEHLAADIRAVSRLVDDVLARAPGSEPVRDWLEDRRAHDWLEAFGERVFAWSSAMPIQFEQHEPPTLPSAAPRVATRQTVPVERSALDRMRERLPGSVLAPLTRLRDSVRPRYWALAGATVSAVIVATVLIPVAPATTTVDATPRPTPSIVTSAPPSAVQGEDPVAALHELISTREGCFRELSVLCLDAVDQQGSSALAQDQQLVRSLQAGTAEHSVSEVSEILIEERLGGTALLTVLFGDNEPASILVMRSEAGWRIRDYVG